MIDHVHAFQRACRPSGRGSAALRPLVALALPLALLLSGCGGSEVPDDVLDADAGTGVEAVNLVRTWEYRQGHFIGDLVPGSPKRRFGFVALTHEEHVFNTNITTYQPPDRGPDAKGEVRSNAVGTSYGVTVDSPAPVPENGNALSSYVKYEQKLFYRKVREDAWLDIKITEIRMEAGDGNTRYPPGCDSSNFNTTCQYDIYGALNFRVEVDRLLPGGATQPVVVKKGFASLDGLMDSWDRVGDDVVGPWQASDPNFIWGASDFEFVTARNGGMATASIKLKSAKVVRLDLGAIPAGESFMLYSEVEAAAINWRQGESGVTVYFQDPISGHALEVTMDGVEPIAVPEPVPDVTPIPLPEPTCTGAADPAAGRFEFDSAVLSTNEGRRLRAFVKRVGGNRGIASVQLDMRGGSATPVADFASFTRTLVFADGQDTARIVDIPIPDDSLAEADETFELLLSEPKGCTELGAASTATVTIIDDETANQTYTLGGTVTGLVGSGLFVRSNGFDVRVDASGPFTLAGTFASGTVYDLQIEAQPGSPPQVCRVTHGQGTIANANVTDLAVACDPPAPPPAGGALDSAFAGGLVSNPSYGRILSMALQPDGRLVVLTDFNRLLRYQVDGTLDASFGSGGVVNATLGGSALDLLRAVALQADGGILVAGVARASGGSTTGDDMGVKRYLPGGTVDTAFGTAGFVRVDIAGLSDDAVAVAVQPDGKIVLGGTAAVTAIGATDFALARLQAHGALDAGFGSGGRLTVNLGGAFDSAAALALQADGAIVLVGRTATSGAATPDTGVARVSASGVVELALKLPLTAHWDEATGVAVQPDGRIVLTLEARPDAAGLYQHALARLKPDGTLDETFGTLGVALAGFSVGGDHARAPVLLADGRIATAGFARNQVQQLSDKDDVLVTRHLADGTLDTSFGNGGKLVIDFYAAADGASALLLQPDGKLVAGGLARSGGNNGLGLVRVLP